MISIDASLLISAVVLAIGAMHFFTAGKKLEKLRLFLDGEVKKSLFGSSFSGNYKNFGYKIYFTSKSDEGQSHELAVEIFKSFDFRAEIRKNNFLNRAAAKFSLGLRETPTGNPLYDETFLVKLSAENDLFKIMPSAENLYKLISQGWGGISISEKSIKAVKFTKDIEDELVSGVILPVMDELSAICSKS
ncbi:MAG: hypothetical protein COT17_08320 [Elusimicrobia bacterium CG08_land_8_20_14_0_20_51_18]|nr:MAG: hypothetical protein COT17_08320 [Elusimicrobia bacterium CG08_land_8_20_14_0_20_51_18]